MPLIYHLAILIFIVSIIIMLIYEPIDEPIDEVWIIKPLIISNMSPNVTDINDNFYEIVLRNQRELIVFDSINS